MRLALKLQGKPISQQVAGTSNLIWWLLTDFTKQFYFMLESCGFGLLSTLNSEGPNSKKSVSGQ